MTEQSEPFELAFEQVKALAQEFKENQGFYVSTDYSEAQARLDFVDKFLTSFGWDVSHNRQKNPWKQEVHVERNVDVDQLQKRADYAFFIDPNFRDVRCYVEAKKPGA